MLQFKCQSFPDPASLILYNHPSGEKTEGMRMMLLFQPEKRRHLLEKYGLDEGSLPGAYLQVSPPGKPFVLWNRSSQEQRMHLPLDAFFDLLAFFAGEPWSSLQTKLQKKIQKMRSKEHPTLLEGPLSYEGDGSLYSRADINRTSGSPPLHLFLKLSSMEKSGICEAKLRWNNAALLEFPLDLALELSQYLGHFERAYNSKAPPGFDTIWGPSKEAAAAAPVATPADGLLDRALNECFNEDELANEVANLNKVSQENNVVAFDLQFLDNDHACLAALETPPVPEEPLVYIPTPKALLEKREAEKSSKTSPTKSSKSNQPNDKPPSLSLSRHGSGKRDHSGYRSSPSKGHFDRGSPVRTQASDYKSGTSSKRPRH